jgi:hypothetical protein
MVIASPAHRILVLRLGAARGRRAGRRLCENSDRGLGTSKTNLPAPRHEVDRCAIAAHVCHDPVVGYATDGDPTGTRESGRLRMSVLRHLGRTSDSCSRVLGIRRRRAWRRRPGSGEDRATAPGSPRHEPITERETVSNFCGHLTVSPDRSPSGGETGKRSRECFRETVGKRWETVTTGPP